MATYGHVDFIYVSSTGATERDELTEFNNHMQS